MPRPFYTLPNDDNTNVEIVRLHSYGYAQADPNAKSRKRKNPVGFAPWKKPRPPRKPRPKGK